MDDVKIPQDESFDQEIKIVRIKNPFTVRIDPFIQTRSMTEDEFMQEYECSFG